MSIVLGTADATDNDREADEFLSCCNLRSKGDGRRSKLDGVSGVCLFFDIVFSCIDLDMSQHWDKVTIMIITYFGLESR